MTTRVLRSWEEAQIFFEQETEIAIDIETSGVNPYADDIGVITMYGDQTDTALVAHVRGVIPTSLKQFIGAPGRMFIGHNITNFDLPFLYMKGCNVFEGAKYYDTLTGELVVTLTGRSHIKNDLKTALKRRLGVSIEKNVEHGHWMAPTLTDQQFEYCLDDIVHIHALRRSQIDVVKRLDEQEVSFARKYNRPLPAAFMLDALELEMAIIPAIMRMAINGMPVNKPRLDEYLEKQTVAERAAYIELVKVLGEINYNSPMQLKKALSSRGIKVESTAYEVLQSLLDNARDELAVAKTDELMEELANKVTLLETILKFRDASQRLKMYREFWDRYVTAGKVHSTFWQCKADTGRFTSSSPNFQQIPGDMRTVFGNVPGYKVVSVDYSAIEVRVAAHLAGDQVMIDALKSEDIHSYVASMVFGKPMSEVGKGTQERQLAKAMSFTLLFGGGAGTLVQYARNSGSKITLPEGKRLVSMFFQKFQAVQQMKSDAINGVEWAKNKGRPIVITLPSGLKRMLQNESLKPTTVLNTSVQGTAAAGLKMGIKLIVERGLHHLLCAAVHDELVALVPEDQAAAYGQAIKEAMIEGMLIILKRANPEVNTPIDAQVGIGDTWTH